MINVNLRRFKSNLDLNCNLWIPGSAVGLMLPDQSPEVRAQFEDVINAFTVMGLEVTQQEQVAMETEASGVKPAQVCREQKDKDHYVTI